MSTRLRQFRGIIVLGLAVAMIPFFLSAYSGLRPPHPPAYSDQFSQSVIVKLNDANAGDGIYFLTSKDLQDLTKIAGASVLLQELTNAECLALGLPIDINTATQEDLMLIPGIGEVTAARIAEKRAAQGRLRNLNDLTAIRGIKHKTLKKISPYLYVDDAATENQPRREFRKSS